MVWLLGGYMWLFVHRPFEIWVWLSDVQVERAYMMVMLLCWAFHQNKGWTPNRLHAALVIFTLVLATSWMASPYMDLPGCTEDIENHLKVMVFYMLVVTSIRDEASLRKLVLLFLAAVGLYISHSLLEYTNGRCMYRMDVKRMIGVDVTFSDPNAFASGLIYALPLTLPFWAMKPSLAMRGLLVGFTALVCLCVVLTGSRTGLLGLGLCALLCLIATGRYKTTAALVVLAVVSAPLALSMLPEDLQKRYLTVIDPSYGPKNAQESFEGRVDGLVLGYDAWTRSPLIGHGPGAFMYATNSSIQPHNLYGQVISELGALGAASLVLLVLCFVLNWREVRRFYKQHPDEPRAFAYHLTQALIVDVVLLLFLGMSGHNLLRYHWVWFAGFQVVALYCVRGRAAQADVRAPDEAAPRPFVLELN